MPPADETNHDRIDPATLAADGDEIVGPVVDYPQPPPFPKDDG